MNSNWFKNEDNLVYINAEKGLTALEKQLQLPGLAAAAERFRQSPTKEGVSVRGLKRTNARLFVPDLTFDEHIEMGENLFLYLGEMSECYVLYWSRPVDCCCGEARHDG